MKHFMLNTANSDLALTAVPDGSGNLILTWLADPNAVLQSSPSLDTPNWQAVSGTPLLGNDSYTLTVPIGHGNQFFRLKQ